MTCMSMKNVLNQNWNIFSKGREEGREGGKEGGKKGKERESNEKLA